MALRKIKDLNVGISGATNTVDVSVAAILRHTGSASSPVYEINTTTANTMYIDNDGDTTATQTGTFDLSNASYDTFGELQDAINAVDGWELVLVGASRADNTYASDLKLLTVAADTAVGSGALLYFDTSNADFATVTIGCEGLTSLTAEARNSADGMQEMLTRDASDDVYGQGGIVSPATVPVLLGASGLIDNTGTGANDWEIIVATQTEDIATHKFAGPADAAQGSIDADELGGEGIIGPEGGRIIVRLNADTAFAAAAWNLSAWGYLGEY